MSSSRHNAAVNSFGDILEKDVDPDTFADLHLEKEYPREFDLSDSDEVDSEMDVLVENGEVAHIYELKTSIFDLGKAFRQIAKAERFLQRNGYEVASDIIVTDPAYRSAREAIDDMDWYFRIDDFKENVDREHRHSYCHLRGAGIISDLSRLGEEIDRDSRARFPGFDYEKLSELGFVKETEKGLETTLKYGKLLRRMDEDEEIYHLTPRDEKVSFCSDI